MNRATLSGALSVPDQCFAFQFSASIGVFPSFVMQAPSTCKGRVKYVRGRDSIAG